MKKEIIVIAVVVVALIGLLSSGLLQLTAYTAYSGETDFSFDKDFYLPNESIVMTLHLILTERATGIEFECDSGFTYSLTDGNGKVITPGAEGTAIARESPAVISFSPGTFGTTIPDTGLTAEVNVWIVSTSDYQIRGFNGGFETFRIVKEASEIVADTTPPTVTGVSPASGNTVSSTSQVQVWFSEPMDSATITPASVQIVDSYGNAVSGTIDVMSTNVLLSPDFQVGKSYTGTVTTGVTDTSGNHLVDSYVWSFSTGGDYTYPTIDIQSPVFTDDPYYTSASYIHISGTAHDDGGLSKVTWANAETGGVGEATGTTGWSADNIPLNTGLNTITFTVEDSGGNTASVVAEVTRTTSNPIINDIPKIEIVSPTGPQLVSKDRLRVNGTASDADDSFTVTWENLDAKIRGDAVGTTSWSAEVRLNTGVQVIVFTVTDAAGNRANTTMLVTYVVPEDPDNGGKPTNPNKPADPIDTSGGWIDEGGAPIDIYTVMFIAGIVLFAGCGAFMVVSRGMLPQVRKMMIAGMIIGLILLIIWMFGAFNLIS